MDSGEKLQNISAPGVNNTYCYNESGLVSKLTKSDGSTIEYYYDDEQLEMEEYRDSSGSVVRLHKYFYDDDGVVRFLQTKNDNFDEPGRYFLYAYIYDGTGTITDLVRVYRPGAGYSDFEPAVHYEYDAYGKILSETNLLYNGENISLFNPIKYKGYYYENNIKMYRLDSRYYDPQIARFLNADNPCLLTESPNALTDKNLYNYCDNNPVMRKDSDGELWFLATAAVGAAVSGGLEILNQLSTDGKITNWGAVGVSAASGAVSSLIPASGLGLIATAVVAVGTEVANNKIKRSPISGTSVLVNAGLSVVGARGAKNLIDSAKHTSSSVSLFGKKLIQSKIGQAYKKGKWGQKINARLKCGRGSVSQAFLSARFGWKTKFLMNYYNSRKSSNKKK